MHTPATDTQSTSLPRLVFRVLAPFACGYFLSYLFRAVNAVVAPNLVSDVGLTASELGLLTSAYLIAFALFQLPLGLLLDRFGPRRVQTGLLCCSAAGSLIFSVAESALALTLARALIGMGFAGGLMSGFKAVSMWLPPERHAIANASIMSIGGLGILVATVPTEIAVQAVGWRTVFGGLAGITLAVAILIFSVVPDRATAATHGTFGQQLAGLRAIYRDRLFWRLVPLVAATAGAHVAIQTLWAGPWFRDVAGLDRDGVAIHLMITAAAFLAGTLLGGIVADWLGRRGIGVLQVMSAALCVYFVAQVAVILEWTSMLIPVWIAFGMTGQLSILAYPWISAYFGTAYAGRAHTATNLLVFGTAFAVQYSIGAVIDLFPTTDAGTYDPRAYRYSFMVILGVQLLAFAWFLPLLRRTAKSGQITSNVHGT